MVQEIRRQVAEAVRAVENKKGENISILEMDKPSGAFTDYFVVCTGTNPRQVQAISDEVQKHLTESGLRPSSVEGYNQAEWVLLDYVDFVVHIFSEKARKFYDLERLWKSAARRTLEDLEKKVTTPQKTKTVSEPKPKLAKKKTMARPKTKKATAPTARRKTAKRTPTASRTKSRTKATGKKTTGRKKGKAS